MLSKPGELNEEEAVKQALEFCWPVMKAMTICFLFLFSFLLFCFVFYYTRSIPIEYKDSVLVGAKKKGMRCQTNHDRQGLDLWLFWFHPETTHCQSCPSPQCSKVPATPPFATIEKYLPSIRYRYFSL